MDTFKLKVKHTGGFFVYSIIFLQNTVYRDDRRL